MKVLYPIKSKDTRPVVCGIARAMAKSQATADTVNGVEPTIRQVQHDALTSFSAFCGGQTPEVLTDDYAALQSLYVSAFVETYHRRYEEIINGLSAMVSEYVQVMNLLNDPELVCLDSF